MVILLNAIKDI
jgi:hypothetical protein